MKALTAFVIAAALIAPQAALAQRHTTPGQAERHAAAQAQAEAQAEETAAERAQEDNEDRRASNRVPAAKAGKVNTARQLRDGR